MKANAFVELDLHQILSGCKARSLGFIFGMDLCSKTIHEMKKGLVRGYSDCASSSSAVKTIVSVNSPRKVTSTLLSFSSPKTSHECGSSISA